MIYLFLSILASSIIFLVFKLFNRFQVNTFQAIVVNYIIACASGFTAYSQPVNWTGLATYSWLTGTVFLGVLFIVIFNLMAITTQRSGLSVVSVATKMSMVIPIAFGLIYYRENAATLKIVGILAALIAVYLVSVKKQDSSKPTKKNLVFPILVFLGSGIIDTSIKFLEDSFVAEKDVPLFSAMIFATAFILGVAVLIFQLIKGSQKIQLKNILGGIALGVPNYFSIYFLVRALRHPSLESSTVFTLNNVGIVMVATLIGILFFKEKLSAKNWIGIGFAILSIILIATIQ
ncbi:EamA-like transporter family protein [Leeuwenhoekiella aestuarii]|uniref:EamA-like transporter family protein n=1 Tax=Leeuwenhoekiella aestuarii TaxID=2249426 RepID=A0A4Q0NVG7_9FLAO|nr:EamA family transporter [Leeuwenhoekiella aestuarii]RXG15528.1 EamA-like transporter family protein [Leeuwenhoekiella aestuarii]RXG17365.1 EamA-like transporter family protein [Leeuwenhoekiella aestuarii]